MGEGRRTSRAAGSARHVLAGFHPVLARVRQAPATVRELYVDVARDDQRMRELLERVREAGLTAHRVAAERLDRLSPQQRHQGVVAWVDAPAPGRSLEDVLDTIVGPPRLLLLDGVTDPRNLGACLRVADGAGVHAVVAPKDYACPLTDVAMATASGAAESVPYVMVTNLARAMDTLQERDIQLLGAADGAPQSLYEQTIEPAVAWVLGAEGVGLRRLTRERCDALVSIPMLGAVASLNVSVAAGIVLYETLRRSRGA